MAPRIMSGAGRPRPTSAGERARSISPLPAEGGDQGVPGGRGEAGREADLDAPGAQARAAPRRRRASARPRRRRRWPRRRPRTPRWPAPPPRRARGARRTRRPWTSPSCRARTAWASSNRGSPASIPTAASAAANAASTAPSSRTVVPAMSRQARAKGARSCGAPRPRPACPPRWPAQQVMPRPPGSGDHPHARRRSPLGGTPAPSVHWRVDALPAAAHRRQRCAEDPARPGPGARGWGPRRARSRTARRRRGCRRWSAPPSGRWTSSSCRWCAAATGGLLPEHGRGAPPRRPGSSAACRRRPSRRSSRRSVKGAVSSIWSRTRRSARRWARCRRQVVVGGAGGHARRDRPPAGAASCPRRRGARRSTTRRPGGSGSGPTRARQVVAEGAEGETAGSTTASSVQCNAPATSPRRRRVAGRAPLGARGR